MRETQMDTKPHGRLRMPRRWVANGAAIRSLREKDGYSQTAFAKAVGMDQANLARIEGGTQFPRPATMRRIADQLRVPIAAITRDANTEDEPEGADAA